MAENLEAPYARHLSRLIRPFPNFDFFFIKPVRQKAVDWLALRPGERVLDLGCGSGGSLPYLVRAVGETGTVTGVDISPQSCRNARRRVAVNGWRNVEILEGPAQDVILKGHYDGALMFAAPDVFASEAALRNVLPCLRDNARVVFFGARLSDTGLGRILNPLLRGAFARLSPATPMLDGEPWALLAKDLNGLRVESFCFGAMFLAGGALRASGGSPGPRDKAGEGEGPAGGG